ncbi:MAG: hypothetical protein ACM3X0_13925 [Bacteroidota bacterium]
MKTTSFLLLGCLVLGSAHAAPGPAGEHRHGGSPAAGSWTSQPLLLPLAGGRAERGAALLQPQGIAAPTLSVFAPSGSAEERRRDYSIDAGRVRIAPASPQIGNYHWLVMREETPELVKVASTAWFFSNPGPVPTAMLAEPKHELEIVPEPLPREHGSYRESEKWRFLLRLNGQPLAYQLLSMETEFGSRLRFVSDAAGFATVLFPRDFRPAGPAPEGAADGHRRPSAGFVLTTEADFAGRHYLTAFNLTYGPDADRERSLGWGAAFGLLGMLAATPLLRRRVPANDGESADV